MVDVQEVLENLRETLIKELDFRNEAEAMKRFKRKKIATELAIERITAGALIVNKLTPNSLKNNN